MKASRRSPSLAGAAPLPTCVMAPLTASANRLAAGHARVGAFDYAAVRLSLKVTAFLPRDFPCTFCLLFDG